MTSFALHQVGGELFSRLSTSALAWTAVVTLLLVLVRPTRTLVIEVFCQIYAALVHWPFDSSSINFLFTAEERPLPHSDSIWCRIQARSIFKWRAQRSGLKHEKHVNWAQANTPRNGDMIEAWDRIAEWDDKCFHPHKLEQLRVVGDPLADNALDHVEQQVATDATQAKTDTLRRIYDQASSVSESSGEENACHDFWKAIDRRPPPGAGALGMDWYHTRYGQAAVDKLEQWPRFASSSEQEPSSEIPTWSPHQDGAIDAQDELQELEAEAEVIRRGQDVFYRYAGPILTVLLHFSLSGGFASPRITEVLKQTAYLIPSAAAGRGKSGSSSSNNAPKLPTIDDIRQVFNVDKARADRTWDRLLETTQFVLDVVEHADSLRPPSCNASTSASVAGEKFGFAPPEEGGDGWQSAVRVRLLHTNVRRRVLKLVQRRRNETTGLAANAYSVEKNGVPINQEDMLATLCAFSVAPLAMLQRIGISPTAQEREDLIALWRHVGFYMGIEPAILRTAFCDSRTADRTLWSTILHLFSNVEIIGAQQGPEGASVGPRMQGPTIPVLIACADRPPFHTPLSAHVAIARRLLGKSLADSLALPASSATREVLTDIAFLGMRIPILFGAIYPRALWEKRRLTLARPLLRRLIVFSFNNKRTKFEMPSSHTAATPEGKEKDSERINVETRSTSHQEVPENKEQNMELVRQWNWLMREMIAVMVLTATLLSALAYLAVVYLPTALRHVR